jgi:F0F1-type ATP synthase membrane subunit b/b'
VEGIQRDIQAAEEKLRQTMQAAQDEDAAVRTAALQMIKEMEHQGSDEAGRIIAAAREEIVGMGSQAQQEIDARKTVVAEADKLSLSVMEKVLDRRLAS